MRILSVFLLICTSTLFAQNKFQDIYNRLDLQGSTTIYDYNKKEWIYTNKKDAQVTSLPASTFKIPNSLIILSNDVLEDENEIYKWDGEPKFHFGFEFKVWEQNTDLKKAYKNSTIWFYEKASKQLNRKVYQNTLKKIGYGNNDLSEKGSDFWNYGSFAISPKNQVEFLIKLYENKLPFSQSTIEKVKQIMISEKTDHYIFRDKTGWTRQNGKDIGWWVGYLTTTDNIYFFATRLTKNIENENPNFLSGRKEVTKDILKDLGAF
ncbi:penicillin-binding transpeptidase domain-containing protein [Zunongwangia sp. HRR-M8]|uniref:penicillin-binding transpeptidase domain-containing protein n=1 Tax=Zunongwangia sp. HRR-M8 TaxID=3015170 RepID=UPI0022DDD53A|nr:penicillin-binding transpeptidase domain-containing protein [Zunongwangia sp. HRR-M8]WBL20954.1 penicillin-binding transpeptidase domain-containing protein [Zunongwangia sp. HRR-M8]